MRRPYDDGHPSGQGRCGVTRRHVEVLSHVDGEHVTVKGTGNIGERSVGGAGQRMSDYGTVGAGGGEECAEGVKESAAVDLSLAVALWRQRQPRRRWE